MQPSINVHLSIRPSHWGHSRVPFLNSFLPAPREFPLRSRSLATLVLVQWGCRPPWEWNRPQTATHQKWELNVSVHDKKKQHVGHLRGHFRYCWPLCRRTGGIHSRCNAAGNDRNKWVHVKNDPNFGLFDLDPTDWLRELENFLFWLNLEFWRSVRHSVIFPIISGR